MLITVHDRKLKPLTTLDNTKQDVLNYSDDKWTRLLESGTSSYEFSVVKKLIDTDKNGSYSFQALQIGNFVSFKYKERDYLFKIMSTSETDEKIECSCEDISMEFLNEYSGAYSAEKAMTLEEYFKQFGFTTYGYLIIGTNEVKDKKLTLKWEGEETKLQRLISVVQNFDAEHEFVTELKDSGKIKAFKINIYKEHSDSTQGVGKKRNDVYLKNGINIDSLKRDANIREVFNMTRPKGKKKITHTRVVKNAVTKETVTTANKKYTGGVIKYANGSLSVAHVQEILTLCVKYSLLPSGVISQLYLESFWGNSAVGRTDNNWAGMSGGAQTRPSGVVVTTGSARPSGEGGTYMHYASVSDFLKDYTYLLAEQKAGTGAKFYGVKGKNNISDYTKGLFRVGGALYDYAAAGYAHYISLMTDIRNGVNRNNGNILDKLDAQWKEPAPTVTVTTGGKGAPNAKKVLQQLASLLNRTLGNGQCYAVSAWYAQQLGGPGLGAGINSISGAVGDTTAAANIGTSYAWGRYKWGVEGPPFTDNKVKAGGIANIKANYGPVVGTGAYGHTVVIESVTSSTITVLEQNFAGKQSVTRNTYNRGAYLATFNTICYPPEIASGGDVNAKASTTTTIANPDGTTKIVEVVTPEEIEITEEEVDLYIDSAKKQEWKNDKGEVEYYLANGCLYAPLSKDKFPSVFSGEEVGDNWIRRDFEYEIDTEERLISESLEKLKKFSNPQLSYEIEGYFDFEPGDQVQIEDDDFYPKLVLDARVSQQEISHSNPLNNKTTFTNFKELDLRVSSDLQAQMYRLAEEAKPYELKYSTDNGTAFKNNEGSSLLQVSVEKSGIEYNDVLIFYKDGDKIIGAGKEFLVRATDFDKTLNVTIEAYMGDELIATGQLTFTDTHDGTLDETQLKEINDKIDSKADSAEVQKQLDEANTKIEGKADSQLTLEQLNALAEQNRDMKADLEAKASREMLDNWITAYQEFLKANEADKAQAEKALAIASARVVKLENNLGELAERWSFIDSYMQASNEGLVIGRNDGSSSMLFSPDGRISMFSAGQEVMYISQGVIHIENGIFSKTIQIGRFREEQYALNLDMNVVRYVGGV